MRILPVLDLLNGLVVHAQRGERDRYRPLQSVLCTNPGPVYVARAYVEKLRCREAYVADLNAIQGGDLQDSALYAIHLAGLRMWLDAGLSTANEVESLAMRTTFLEMTDLDLVLGLETWHSPAELGRAVSVVGAKRLVFSIDLKGGAPLTKSDQWSRDPLAIAGAAISAGLQRILVLDLAKVGTEEGPSVLELCRDIKGRWPHIELSGGGGVRTAEDCRQLSMAGCDVILVATALHRGALTAQELAELRGDI